MPDDDDKPAPTPFTVDVTVDRTRVPSHAATSARHCGDGRGDKDHDRAEAADFVIGTISDRFPDTPTFP